MGQSAVVIGRFGERRGIHVVYPGLVRRRTIFGDDEPKQPACRLARDSISYIDANYDPLYKFGYGLTAG